MWISVEEAERMAKTGGGLLDPDSMLPQKATEDALTGVCPFGHGLLIRAKVDVDDPFYLERCGRCGGIWFDGGEWQKLASTHLVFHLRDLWDPGFQRKMIREKAEKHHRDHLVASIGADVVTELETLADKLKQNPHGSEAVAYFLGHIGWVRGIEDEKS
jgi:Zn-finger nucleic acid-binding protein